MPTRPPPPAPTTPLSSPFTPKLAGMPSGKPTKTPTSWYSLSSSNQWRNFSSCDLSMVFQSDGDRFLCILVWALPLHRAGFQVNGVEIHRRGFRQDRCWWTPSTCLSWGFLLVFVCLFWGWIWWDFDLMRRMCRSSGMWRRCRRSCLWRVGRRWAALLVPKRTSLIARSVLSVPDVSQYAHKLFDYVLVFQLETIARINCVMLKLMKLLWV